MLQYIILYYIILYYIILYYIILYLFLLCQICFMLSIAMLHVTPYALHDDCWWKWFKIVDEVPMFLWSCFIIAHWVWFDFAHIISSFVSRLLLQHLPCVWRQLRRLKWYVFVILDIVVVIIFMTILYLWRWWCPWCGDDGSALDCDVSRRVVCHGCMCCVVLMIAMFVVRLFGDAVARRVSHADVVFNIAMLSLQMLSCEVAVAWWLRCCCRVLLLFFWFLNLWGVV